MDHYLFQNREAQKELLASNDDLSDNNITKVSDLKKKKKQLLWQISSSATFTETSNEPGLIIKHQATEESWFLLFFAFNSGVGGKY